ncbi:unnamed protein product [Penicillium salamii]|uniref:SnoaL-like domain-containing protein n=1 Tax=Penicillium salamii TaxID=1612424 RepID=A0A9W4NU06_9EURO|nr:unnamed protein product [Penicillium salamii]
MIFTRYVLCALAASLQASGAILSGNSQDVLRSGCDGSGVVDGGHCNGTGVVDDPTPHHREGFQFENPSTDCKYVSQMYIWDSFKVLEKDMMKFVHADPQRRPIYRRRAPPRRRPLPRSAAFLHLFEIHPQGIYGGCNAEWSVQEIQFKGVMNSGDKFDIVNVWFTRWHRGQMVEIRTYIDGPRIIEALHKNEIWWNGTTQGESALYARTSRYARSGEA